MYEPYVIYYYRIVVRQIVQINKVGTKQNIDILYSICVSLIYLYNYI